MSTIDNPRSRFHSNYLPRFDAIVASGVSPQAAASVLSNELENARIMRNAKPVASAKPVAPKATPKAAVAPAPSEKPMTAADYRVLEATYRAIEAHHRSQAAVVDERSAESAALDAKFGLAPKAALGVVFDPNSGLQTFGVPVSSKTVSAPPRAHETAPVAASHRMPAPSPGLTSDQTAQLEAAFGGGTPADGVFIQPGNWDPAVRGEAVSALSGRRLQRPFKFSAIEMAGATQQTYQGGRACVDTSTGLVVKGVASNTLIPIGVFTENQNTQSGGTVHIQLDREVVARWYENSASTDQITTADILKDVYVIDDQTVAKTNGGNTRSIAGRVWKIDSAKGAVLVESRP